MTLAELAEERRDEIDEWCEGGFLGASTMASAYEEGVPTRLFTRYCRRAATRNSIGSSMLDRSSSVSWGATEASASLLQLPRFGPVLQDTLARIAGQREA